MNKQLIYYSDYGHGGFGDHIVGLISVMIMAKHLSRDFRILWELPPINDFIDFGEYKYIP